MPKKKDSKTGGLPLTATDIILESISEGVFTVDLDWRITSFNRAAEEITGIPRDEAIGKYCWEVFRTSMCEADCPLRQTMSRGKPTVSPSVYFVNGEQRRIPVTVSSAVLKDADGNIVGGVETFRDISQVEALKNALDSRFQIGDMVSRSPIMQKLFRLLPQAAESDSTILIQGETGTGKELLARAIHDLSGRRDKPFMTINCGALPDTLLESELFGYKAGAFTQAVKDKPGYFKTADGGTLLLDEIGDISPAFQVKLLRVIQDKTFIPLGSTREVTSNVRILAATHQDLEALVGEGRFRQDLYYRINVIRLKLPPLRERKEDIPLLVERFIDKTNRLRARTVKGISPEALAVLMAHDFPGNIRELENIIEHAFVLCGDGPILPEHLPDQFHSRVPRAQAAGSGSMASAKNAAEVRQIRDALEKNRYNRLAAARDLGIHKSTLFRKIKALGIELPETDGRSGKKP
jgi:PAS domain S-box-containing protein